MWILLCHAYTRIHRLRTHVPGVTAPFPLPVYSAHHNQSRKGMLDKNLKWTNKKKIYIYSCLNSRTFHTTYVQSRSLHTAHSTVTLSATSRGKKNHSKGIKLYGFLIFICVRHTHNTHNTHTSRKMHASIIMCVDRAMVVQPLMDSGTYRPSSTHHIMRSHAWTKKKLA